ncbi:MAG: TIM barrel protein [Oxalobacteraceae bacterium]|nr:TIM barrel protein [Oxalobacteraceae bacterium]
MSKNIEFSLNRISAPRIAFSDYLALCQRLNIKAIEIRNDLDGVELNDGTPAEKIRDLTAAAGITIRSINALQRFDQFDAAREVEAREVIAYAAACGAEALVLCPTCSPNDSRTAVERHEALVAALKALKPMLADHGVLGLIEPLGFEICAVRRKSQAVLAMYDAAGENDFKLVHDTFHHHLSGEDIFFPNLTGLIHISGVEDGNLPVNQMGDGHRVLVGEADRLGNLRQLKVLLGRGYQGYVSYEPFAAEIAAATDIESRLRTSMSFIRTSLD